MKSIPHPLTILMIIVVVAAAFTWVLPAGKYDTLSFPEGATSFTLHSASDERQLPFTQRTLDSLGIKVPLSGFTAGDIRKPLSVPGSYHTLPSNSQGLIEVLEAPIKGIYDTIDIILFVLVIGGFIEVFYATGAMESGLGYLSGRMHGREGWLIILLTFLLSFGGASYGMAEEALAFFPVLVPLFLAAGYDLLVPVAVIFGGTQLGTLSSFTNPFSTIIASNAAGINWTDGLYGRLVLFVVSTGLYIFYTVRYAEKVKKNPQASWVFKTQGLVSSPFGATTVPNTSTAMPPSVRHRLLLLLFLATFLVMIGGVVFLHWWLLEMSAVFLVASVLVAAITRMGEKNFVLKFIKGAEGLLGVVFIIGVARGVTVILNEGTISDTIVYRAANLVSGMPPSAFIVALLLLYMVFTLFISSSSGMAVVTMPVIGSLAFLVGIPGREIVNSYLYGMGIMGFISPTGLLLPSLAMAGINPKAWLRFIAPFMIVLFLICAVFLVVGIYR